MGTHDKIKKPVTRTGFFILWRIQNAANNTDPAVSPAEINENDLFIPAISLTWHVIWATIRNGERVIWEIPSASDLPPEPNYAMVLYPVVLENDGI